MSQHHHHHAPVGQSATGSQNVQIDRVGEGASIEVSIRGEHHHYAAPRRELLWPVVPVQAPGPVSAYQHRAVAETIPTSGSVVVSGPSGYGKTQIAAGLFADSTADLRLWVSAGTADSVVAGYADAALSLDLLDATEPIERRSKVFLSWLAATDRSWLVVLDNLDHPDQLAPIESLPAGLWPPARPAGLTVATTTSRDPLLRDGGRTRIDINPYSHDEAAGYLTERLTPALDTGELPVGALDQADQLADDLGYHPLALGQAAAYILADALTIPSYQALLAAKRVEQALPERAKADGYTGTVATTWTIALQRARHLTHGLAEPLLLYLAHLDPNGAPHTLLTTTSLTDYLTQAGNAGKQDQTADPEVLTAVQVLHRLSLITYLPGQAPRALRTHPLTSRITREHATADQHKAATRAAANSLFAIWPDPENDTTHATVLRSNATTITGHDHHQALWDEERYQGAHPLLSRHCESLGQAGHVKPAIARCTELVELSTRLLGPDHPDTLGARVALVSWRHWAGDSGGSPEALEMLLADHKRVMGPDHPQTLMAQGRLASFRGEAGDLAGAAAGYEKLLADRRRVMGPNHRVTLSTQGQVAHWRGESGDSTGAAAGYAKVLANQLKALGPDHPDILTTRNNLARWRGEAGDYDGAALESEQLLTDRQRVQSADHPDILTARNNVAWWRGQAGDAAGAAAAYEELLPDLVRVLGPDNPSTLATRGNLAQSRGQAGDPAGAVRAYQELLTDRLRILDPHHPLILTTRFNLAWWHGQAGDAAGAAAAYQELLTDRLRVLGPDHPHTLATRSNLAWWRGEAGDPTGAAVAYQQLLTDQVRILGPDHSHTRITRSNLAHYLAISANGDQLG